MTTKLLSTILAAASALTAAGSDNLLMPVGTYTDGGSDGIYIFSFNQANAEFKLLSSTLAENPSFLALSPDGKHVYAVDESGKASDSARAFAFRSDSIELKHIGKAEPTGGAAPCYISTNGRIVATANYTGGSLTVFGIKPDGSLTPARQHFKYKLTGKAPDKQRQNAAHVH